MSLFRGLLNALALAGVAAAQQHVSFPTEDGGLIFADLYGRGERGVVLVHGGQFNKESWVPEAGELEKARFHVLAIDMRSYAHS